MVKTKCPLRKTHKFLVLKENRQGKPLSQKSLILPSDQTLSKELSSRFNHTDSNTRAGIQWQEKEPPLNPVEPAWP